jgi:hypothetical protein
MMSMSIVPYLLFLYLIYQVWRLDPRVIHKVTVIGFFCMLGFVAVTATVGIIALKVIGAATLGHVDGLHALAEATLTITNGLIAFGLKKQLDAPDPVESEDASAEQPALAGAAGGSIYPSEE